MELWVVSQHYRPETGAPSARISGLAKSWLAEGHQVTVLTGVPNHPEGVVHPEYIDRPRFLQETLDGVPVRRHWLYVAPNKGKWPRLFSQLSFTATVLLKNWRLKGKSGSRIKPDIIMASSPTFFPVLAAWLLARRHRAKFVFEVRDLWPAIFVQMGLFKAGSLPVKLLEVLEMFLYRRADAVVTVTRSFARAIHARGIPADKLQVVFNGVSDEDLRVAAQVRLDNSVARLRAQLGLSPLSSVVLYIGNHGEAQALGQVIDAARLMVRRTDVLFLMVGSGADKDRLISYTKGVPNVQFLPPVSHKDVWTYYALADVNIVCLRNIPDFDMFVPSKMFEIMAAQSCAVAGLRGEGAEIMQESGCALVVPSEEPEKMATALMTLLDDADRRKAMAVAGRAYVEQNFRHSLLAAGYSRLFARLLGQAPAGERREPTT